MSTVYLASDNANAFSDRVAAWKGSDGALPTRWTPEQVQDRVIAALDVIRRTPMTIGPKSFGGAWPQVVQDFSELIDQDRFDKAVIARNWRTVENMHAVAEKEISDIRARDEAEAARRGRRKRLPTALENSLAMEAIRWPMLYLQENPLHADALMLWARCMSETYGAEDQEKRAGASIAKALRARCIKADTMILERRRAFGAIRIDTEKAKAFQEEALAWANTRIEAKQRAFSKIPKPTPAQLGRNDKIWPKEQERADKEAKRYASKARELAEYCEYIKSQARDRFHQQMRSAGAVEEKIVIRRADVMPDTVTSRTWLDLCRKAAASQISDALNRSRVPVR